MDTDCRNLPHSVNMIPQLATVAALLVGSSLAVPSNVEKLRRVDTPVENSYIVVLKDSVDRGAKLQALDKLVVTSKHVKQVVYSDWKGTLLDIEHVLSLTVTSVLNGYSAQLSGAALEHVLADPDVDYVEENGAFTINWTAEPVPAREPAPEADPAPRRDTVHQLYRRAGEGVVSCPSTCPITQAESFIQDIYGIDTGIFVNHTSFGGRARWGAVFGGYKQQDGNGHGTHSMSFNYARYHTLTHFPHFSCWNLWRRRLWSRHWCRHHRRQGIERLRIWHQRRCHCRNQLRYDQRHCLWQALRRQPLPRWFSLQRYRHSRPQRYPRWCSLHPRSR